MVNFNESHHGSSPCGEMGLGELVPKAFNASPSTVYGIILAYICAVDLTI